jgi:hypothetical protein
MATLLPGKRHAICRCSLIAAISTALLVFRGERAPVLTPQEAAE